MRRFSTKNLKEVASLFINSEDGENYLYAVKQGTLPNGARAHYVTKSVDGKRANVTVYVQGDEIIVNSYDVNSNDESYLMQFPVKELKESFRKANNGKVKKAASKETVTETQTVTKKTVRRRRTTSTKK